MINETGVYFFPGGGHDHDGESASLIDTNSYSIFDFPWTTEIGGPDRKRRLENNYNSFKNFIITTVNDSIIRPAGIFFQPGSINASSDIITNSITTNLIQAGAITADLIAANTITANNIQAGAITGNLLNANVVLVNQVIASNNYVTGVSGWAIDGDGTAEFGDAAIRGTIDIGGNDATSFHVNSNGDVFVGATTFNAAPFKVSSVGSVTAVSGNIAGFEFVSGTNLLHTGGSFLGTLDLGLISGNGVSANSRVGLEVIGPQPPGKRLEALYDYLYIYREDTGSGVLLTPEGDITATGEITGTDGINAGGGGVTYDVTNLPGTHFPMAFGWDATNAEITFIVNNDVNVDGFITPDGFYSDRRLKENISSLSNEVLEKIYSIKIYEFDYKDDIPYESLRGKHAFGVIADEMESLFPELVVHKDDLEKYKQVVYVKTIPLLLGVIGDLNTRLKALEQQLGYTS